MIRVFTRQMQKLHSEEGQALVFVAMVGLVIFLFIAMTMNLAEVINVKIKNQNVADATALSGAAWQARALNTVAGMNQRILEWWAVFLAELFVGVSSLWVVGAACCNWTCMSNPACTLALILYGYEIFTFLTHYAMANEMGMLQNDVVNTFTEALLLQDLPQIVNLNYEFKENLRDLETELYLYTHENGGNLWIDMGGPPGTNRYVLERVGCCEIMVSLYYYFCRAGRIASCQPNWRLGWQAFLTSIDNLYQGPSPGPRGSCYQSDFASCALFGPFMHPLGLHTYRATNWDPEDFEELLPVTAGVYRQRIPPVVHLWGVGLLRPDMDCTFPPVGKENWFPCTDQGHFAFATAHPYSNSVHDFYQSFVDAGISTPYPVPLAFTEMDWEERLFAMEPLQEQGDQSPECGWQAYDDILTQVGVDLGAAEEDYLRDNRLEAPGPGNRTFFLY